MSARFEVVHTDAAQPWHARFRAANGRIVWTTEQYARRAGALGAINALRPLRQGTVELRLVDEREARP